MLDWRMDCNMGWDGGMDYGITIDGPIHCPRDNPGTTGTTPVFWQRGPRGVDSPWIIPGLPVYVTQVVLWQRGAGCATLTFRDAPLSRMGWDQCLNNPGTAGVTLAYQKCLVLYMAGLDMCGEVSIHTKYQLLSMKKLWTEHQGVCHLPMIQAY